MSRTGSHVRRDRMRKGSRAETSKVPSVVLRELRFDTQKASDRFLRLRYMDPVFAGSSADGIRLPPVDESVSSTPKSGAMVYKAFPHGLMYGDQVSMMAGGGLFLAAIIALAFCKPLLFGGESFFAISLSTIRTGGLFEIILHLLFYGLILLFSPLALVLILGDVIGFRFETSALFDRNAGKIHLLSDHSMPWAPWRSKLKSYDWLCVRAEVDTVTLVTGPVVRMEAGLRCVVMDRPNGDTVVDQFVLGVNMPAQHIQPLLDTWEHVRRFMQREGPLFFDQHDMPNKTLGRQPLWRHLVAGPKLQIWATFDMFRIAWSDKSLLAVFAGIIGIACLPALVFTMLWGFLPWISALAKRDPEWPTEIIASVGGASLRGKDLEAWRGLIPEQKNVTDRALPDRLEVKDT